MSSPLRGRLFASASASACLAVLVAAAPGLARERSHDPWRPNQSQFNARVLVQGATIMHPLAGGSEPVSNPDDITHLGDHIFVAFANGLGPQGQPSPSDSTDSTIVEFTPGGQEIAQWDIAGKCDGLTADPWTGELIATVNEDANSSLYTLRPQPGAVPVHYQYNEALPSNGGTDSIAVYGGAIFVSASAPGTIGAAAPQASYPAVYQVTLDRFTDTAYVNGLYSDEAPATVANTNSGDFGQTVSLALTDPDSSTVVPRYASRFAGDFVLDSQGDQEQIYYGGPAQPLAVLSLPASVNDSAWPAGRGDRLYVTDTAANEVLEVTGPFQTGSEIAAVTPCDSNNAPSTCPAPGYPANYLGVIDQWTGAITPLAVSGPSFQPQGLLLLHGDGEDR